MTLRLFRLIVFFTACSVSNLFGQSSGTSDVGHLIESNFRNRIVSLRHVLDAPVIKYDETGHLIGNPPVGDWTLHSRFEITSAEFKNGILKLKGNRVGLSFEDWESDKKPTNLRTSQILELQIAVDKNTSFNLERELRKVFLTANESLPENVPPHWIRLVTCHYQQPPATDCEYKKQSAEEFTFASDLTEPKVKKQKQPSYTAVARQARLQGSIHLVAIVDTNGVVGPVEIVKPLGLGLDEAGIRALKTWTFIPGKRAGTPLPVWIDVYMSFSLGQ